MILAEGQIEPVKPAAESWTADEVLRWAFETYDRDVAIASAFGAEGVVLIDIAARIRPRLRVFMLDTGFLFPETAELITHVENTYRIRVERVFPDCTPKAQEEIHGPGLWDRDPHLCCQIRKVEPLKKKLAGLRAWITAIRRDQTPARAKAGKVAWDPMFGLVKINPLADWTEPSVWNYIRNHGLTYNPLHDRNYPSIGCTHCTRPVRPGEAPRAGRWSGLGKTECGLHDQSSRGHSRT